MKNILQEYVPFEHDNLEYVNNLIAFARQQRQNNTSESVIASSVIYANLVEYLVTHLLKNIEHMVYLSTYFQFQSVFFMKSDEKKLNNRTLGQLKNELNYYEFPDKMEFMKLLELFSASRNSLLHRLMSRKTQEEISKLDGDIVDIQTRAEEVLQKYNVITEGLKSIWQKVTASTSTAST